MFGIRSRGTGWPTHRNPDPDKFKPTRDQRRAESFNKTPPNYGTSRDLFGCRRKGRRKYTRGSCQPAETKYFVIAFIVDIMAEKRSKNMPAAKRTGTHGSAMKCAG